MHQLHRCLPMPHHCSVAASNMAATGGSAGSDILNVNVKIYGAHGASGSAKGRNRRRSEIMA